MCASKNLREHLTVAASGLQPCTAEPGDAENAAFDALGYVRALAAMLEGYQARLRNLSS